jgi:uncharacterized membrane protein
MTSTMRAPDIESSIFIERPPEDIWSYLVKVSNDVQWHEIVNDAKWFSDPPYAVGSTGIHIAEGIGDCPWTIIEWQEPHIMAWEFTGGRLKGGQGAYRLELEGSGSRVFIETSVPRGIVMKLMMLFLKRRLERTDASDLAKLKAIMEA